MLDCIRSTEHLEEEDKVQIQDDIQADSNIQLDIKDRNHLGPEYQNDIGLWRDITEDVRNFWCNRNSTECQHFDRDFSASCRHYSSFQKALQVIAEDMTQKLQVIHEAKRLLKDAEERNTIMAGFWTVILNRIN
ncbi:hypothetical protein TNCV_1209241 [Trichonephila clavipes]|nr:hypothetical protein TNCV_1209241 [Trichonephila clavipes]